MYFKMGIMILLIILFSGCSSEHFNPCCSIDENYEVYSAEWKHDGLKIETVVGIYQPTDIIIPIITKTNENIVNISYSIESGIKDFNENTKVCLCGIMKKRHTFFIENLSRQKYKINLYPLQNQRDGNKTYSIFVE